MDSVDHGSAGFAVNNASMEAYVTVGQDEDHVHGIDGLLVHG